MIPDNLKIGLASLLVTLSLSAFIFLYFRNRMSSIEHKINTVFHMIQEHNSGGNNVENQVVGNVGGNSSNSNNDLEKDVYFSNNEEINSEKSQKNPNLATISDNEDEVLFESQSRGFDNESSSESESDDDSDDSESSESDEDSDDETKEYNTDEDNRFDGVYNKILKSKLQPIRLGNTNSNLSKIFSQEGETVFNQSKMINSENTNNVEMSREQEINPYTSTKQGHDYFKQNEKNLSVEEYVSNHGATEKYSTVPIEVREKVTQGVVKMGDIGKFNVEQHSNSDIEKISIRTVYTEDKGIIPLEQRELSYVEIDENANADVGLGTNDAEEDAGEDAEEDARQDTGEDARDAGDSGEGAGEDTGEDVEEGGEVSESENLELNSDFEKWTVNELKKEAARRKLKNYHRLPKKKLIELLSKE